MDDSSITEVRVAPQALSIAAVAEALNVSQPFVRLEIARGKIRVCRLGRRVLITPNELRRYLQAHMDQETGQKTT
jgi:excisionase family DNA binding protein